MLDVVGVVGGGQLARMMLQEAIPLGIELRFMVDTPDDPAALVSRHHTVGSPTSVDDLMSFARTCDVLTFDHEVVDLDALVSLEADGHLLRPGADTFRSVSHKGRMRAALAAAGIPTPPALVTRDPKTAAEMVASEGPQVIKLAHGGYDGRGTFFVDRPEEALRIVESSAGTDVLVEPHLDILSELAVIVVRSSGGDRVTYDPVSTIQVDGQCRRVDAPARLPAATLDAARGLAREAAESVAAIGVLAVELFVTRDGLLVNELAARPHNTGHHTLDAATTSQFANHLRAVADLPLGSPRLTSAAVTANVIGRDDRLDPRARLAEALRLDSEAHIHLYGKAPRHDRKLGHVTVCDDDHDRAVRRVAAVVEGLGGQEVPT
ncbi:MAG TPA: 5-(carboxyamino)imidazole ribonucleotide synthase [Acidimicrobiia bacterium]|nr:5-(carboxyamino)imidazole ribonucleotide synthase [Acidimicrobiia bacterium]